MNRIAALASLDRCELGRSFEGRPIELITLGTGPRRVMAWSQMHGDEPTHTSVLLELIERLATQEATKGSESDAAEILETTTLLLIVMLNPDGAERDWRFNAQGIDINRDARALASAEARLLHDAVRELKPEFAFNLHNQNRRDRMPDREEPVAVSLLAPPMAPSPPGSTLEGSLSPSFQDAQKLCSVVLNAAAPHCGGRVLRYGAEYMPRAFGEWVQSQGVSTVLIEACNLPGGTSPEGAQALEKLHLDAFVETLLSIGSGAYLQADPQQYLDLPRQAEHRLFDLLVRGGQIEQPWGTAATSADVGINDVSAASVRSALGECKIADIGDLEPHGGLVEVDAAGCVIVPLPETFDSHASPSDQINAIVSRQTVEPMNHIQRGEHANLAIIKRGDADSVRLQHVILNGTVTNLTSDKI